MNLPAEVNKYLARYSCPGWNIEWKENSSIDNVVVIPAIKELSNIKELLSSLSVNDPQYFPFTLFLFVVNNTSSAEDEIKKENRETAFFLRNVINAGSYPFQIGLIDASPAGKELPEKDGGVGFARKIGMDAALTIFNYNSSSKKILICLDADCTVSGNYLTSIIEQFNKHDLSAAVINYHHNLENNTEAIICYEIFLRYYTAALSYARSHYAFQTIGSAMACGYLSYIKTEGMNKKKAAEDFYFLEKLAKNYTIAKINDAVVYPSARGSWRVPFGTGQRVNRFISGTQDEYRLYNPQSFMVLKEWLNCFNCKDFHLLPYAKDIDENLYNFLVLQNFDDDWKKIFSSTKSDKQLQKQKLRWFDGFKTLKLIHYLRNTAYPDIFMFDAVDRLFSFYNITPPHRGENNVPPVEIQKEYLYLLRELENNSIKR